MNGLNNLDETRREYLLARTDGLIRFWRSKIKVTAGLRGDNGIHVSTGPSKFHLLVDLVPLLLICRTVGIDCVLVKVSYHLVDLGSECVLYRVVNGVPQSVSASSIADIRVGMVRDGSPCGTSAMCVNRECVSLDRVMPATCPLGHNGLVCSGHGVS